MLIHYLFEKTYQNGKTHVSFFRQPQEIELVRFRKFSKDQFKTRQAIVMSRRKAFAVFSLCTFSCYVISESDSGIPHRDLQKVGGNIIERI